MPRGEGPIDLRCASSDGDEHRHAGFAGWVEDLGPSGSAPWLEDIADPGATPARWPCVAWAPSAQALAQAGELAARAGGWMGMVRCELGGPRTEAALAEWCIGPLATALADARVPLALDITGALFSLDAVFGLAVSHPTLAIVLRVEPELDSGLLLALLASTPNVLLETSGLDSAVLTEAVAIDATRVAFGSGSPRNDPAAELARVADSIAGEGLLEQISAVTAAELLGPNGR